MSDGFITQINKFFNVVDHKHPLMMLYLARHAYF